MLGGMKHRGEPRGFFKFSSEELADDAIQETAQRVADHIEKVRRVRFEVDPSKTDAEIARGMEEHFGSPDERDAVDDSG